MPWRSRVSLTLAACLFPLALPGGCSKPADSADRGPGRHAAEGGDARPRGAAAAEVANYNVLLVTLDTTRVDYLSSYDSSHGALTPNFDAVADDGIRFDFAISPSPATPMSHASILTGLWPYQHGVRVISAASGYKLSPQIPTLTTRLKDAGWSTGAFLSAFTVSEYYGFDHGFDTFDNGLTQDPDTILHQEGARRRWSMRAHQRRSDATTERAAAWLRSGAGRPFFLWVHYWDPHDRMVLPPRDVLARWVAPPMPANGPAWKRAVYEAEIHYMDSRFGRLLRALRDTGIYNETIIVIVADHGQGLGQHDWWAHRLLYQEHVHVPLIMRVPGWPAGKTVPALVRTVDIFPTALEAVGLATREGIAGESLRGLALGESASERLAYAEVLNRYDLNSPVMQKRPDADLLYTTMDRSWKLIYRYTRPEQSELYNLIDDPHELHNLFQQKPEEVRRLKGLLDEHNGYVTAPFSAGAPDAAAMRALKSLGYVGDDEEGGEETSAEPNEGAEDTRPTSRTATRPARP